MKAIYYFFLLILVILFGCDGKSGKSGVASKNDSPPPKMEIINGKTRLIVNDQPFIALAGEVHNSSSSSLKYMEPIWPKLVQMNLNTVLLPVSWELFEPVEGEFKFELIDGLIQAARVNNLKIVFLWFGSWKNMVSTYVPDWVKNDPKRFPLLIAKNGEKFQMLSTFSKENIRADAVAFAALMKHIRQVDSNEQTVIMIQVQNEVGTNGGERDYSDAANSVYHSQVPEKLISNLMMKKSSLIPEFDQTWAENGYKTVGNWEQIFGGGAAGNEIFMAWQLSSYIGEVIKAGKKEYDIPMFVNASVGRQDQKLGTYPSGGPVAFVIDIWRAGAPELDMLCPDIYYGDFIGHCKKYTQSGNPLFIPETRAGDIGAARALIAICNFNALGFSPFGIEGRSGLDEPLGENPLAKAYDIVDQMSHLILDPGIKNQLAVMVDSDNPDTTVNMGHYQIDIKIQGGRTTDGNPVLGYALLIEIEPEEYVIAGKNVNIQFSLSNRQSEVTGIRFAEEGKFEKGIWIPGRRLNGDQIMVSYSFSDLFSGGKSGNGLKFGNSLTIQSLKLYSY